MRIPLTMLAAGTLVLGALAVAAPALAQRGTAPAPAGPKTDATYEGAKAAFEALPEAERKAVQEALVWTGDYNAGAGGTFGRRTYDAIVAYQRRAKQSASGTLDDKSRADLVAAGRRVREAAKFAVAIDPKTGAEIGVPERVLAKRGVNPNGGSRWQSADGKITLDTRAIPAGEADLAALYERNLAIQAAGRQVTYKLLRPDFFVVSGETATGKFYTHYAAGPGGLRGFSVGYDKGLAKEFDPLLIAIANSFTPFPEPRAAATPAPPARPAVVAPAAPLASGLVVAPGRVLTSAVVEGCAAPAVGGKPARVVRTDTPADLALVDADVGVAATVAVAAGATEGDVLVLSHAVSGAEVRLFATPATLEAVRLSAPLQLGAAGAPVFDRAGALTAVVGSVPTSARVVAGIVPAATYPAVPAQALAAFLAGAGVALPSARAGSPRTAGEIAGALRGAVVAITCAR